MVANVTGADPVDVRAHRRRWYALVLLCAAFSMVVLDSTIVYVALPSIQQALGFSAAGVQWVITVYLLTFAGLLLLGGRTADLVGRRTVFMVGVALFTLASLGCALAPSAGVLLAARVVQGVAAAMLTPAALALLITTFAGGAERNRALGIWGAIGGVGATAGLLVGGPITDGFGWEWIFLINVPVGLVLLAASPVLRDSRQEPGQHAYDPAGAVTITAGLIVFVYAIVGAPVAGWASARTVGLLAAAATLIMLFVLVESRAPVPLVRLGLFRSPVRAGGNLVIVTMGMTVDAVLFTLTLYTQEVLHYSAVQFGLMMAAMTAVSVVGSYAGQALVTGVGVHPVAVVGTALVGVGCLLLTRISVHASFLADLLPALVVFGLGLGSLRGRQRGRAGRRRRAGVGVGLRGRQHLVPHRRRARGGGGRHRCRVQCRRDAGQAGAGAAVGAGADQRLPLSLRCRGDDRRGRAAGRTHLAPQPPCSLTTLDYGR
jgi:EmrB/QacA subfamily drug resistance transporter